MADLYGIKDAARQRKLADALRKQAESAQPQGQMVSGHFVAPSWSQHLNTLATMVGSGWAENKAQEAETASEGKLQEARQKWTSSIPQAVAAEYDSPKIEGLGGRERMAEPQVLKQAVPLTHSRIMEHYLAGAEIPGNEKIAQAYLTGAQADLSREDTQAENRLRRETEAAAKLEKDQADRAARLEQLNRELENKALDRASREAYQQQALALQASLAQGNQMLRQMQINLQAQDLERKTKEAAAKQAQTTEGEKSAAGYLTRMNAAEELLKNAGAEGEIGPFEKAVGGIPMIGPSVQPYVTSGAQQKVLQAQRDWVRAKLRKESGATIGDKEMDEEIRTYFPQPGEGAEVIAQKAAARQTAMRQLEIMSGRALPEASWGPTTKSGAPAAAPAAAPVKVRTQADVDKLKSGTRFTGPDGKQYTKD